MGTLIFEEDQQRSHTAGAARLAGLILCCGTALAAPAEPWPGWVVVVALFVAATAADRCLPARLMGPAIAGEAVAIAVAACAPLTSGLPAYTYLLIPPVAAGLRYGHTPAFVVSGLQYAVVAVDLLVVRGISDDLTLLVWVSTGLLLGQISAAGGRALSSSISQAYASAAYEERRQLSREIHDGVAQDLAVLGFQVDRLLLGDTRTVERATVAELGDDVRRMLQEVRWSIHDLRGGRLPEVSLATALADHVRRAAATAGMTAHLSITEGTRRLPSAVEFELLRIAQEAVTNSRKHSGARNLWVELEAGAGRALLRVSDDGSGARPAAFAARSGFGMAIMRERARSIGADLAFAPRAGGGTVVEARIVPQRRPAAVARQLVGRSRRSAWVPPAPRQVMEVNR